MNQRVTSLWSWAVVGSAVFHVGLVFAASLLPDGTGRGGAGVADQLFTPGAVIPLETVPLPYARTEPTGEPGLPAVSPDARAPIDQPKSNNPSPRGGSEPPPDLTHTESETHDTPGVSLHGMRDGARASTTGSGVVVDPALLNGSRGVYEDSVNNPGVGSGAMQGPAAPAGAQVDYSFKNEKGKLVYRDPSGRFVATLRADGRVDFRNKGAKASWTQIGMGGPGDLLSAAAGDDPYARIKHKLLKATFEMRLGMAVTFQKKQLDKRLQRLGGELDKIWADTGRGLGARKELLFQRWDECDEPEASANAQLPGFGKVDNSELDDARQDTALSARRLIEKFIREHAPKGSAEAFTPAELADMNRRRASTQKFQPY
ncbi:hypothetical protein DB30_04205 [Enhygromyxa salina]|uniref:Uncharacterized protein n=1 Tax=Enhygromyxa salina TaxID=215803 RepID=A0A0C2DA10_9BACT|nr:hypothetical protein [Enhygromyxa salina]KIG16732.1 hypothetical protein DB30_04205 [Enhygromyxa salina]